MFERLRLQTAILIGSLRTSGLRSLLVIAAVAIGSASLTSMLAMSAGAQRRLDTLTDIVGRNLFMIKPGRAVVDAESSLLAARITLVDAATLAEEVADVRNVLPVLQRNAVTVSLAGESVSTTVLGVTEPYFAARNWEKERGRLLDELDDLGGKRVAVVGAALAKSLRAGEGLLGATVSIAGVPFEVIGQLREKGLGYGAQNEDGNIYVPLQSSIRRLFGAEDLSHVLVQVREGGDMTSVERAVRAVLRRAHRLPAGSADDFEILQLIKQNQVSTLTQALVHRMTRFLAAILLVLGGIGVFAVTYLSVMQRMPEIGLRRALGARQFNIATLFTSEACVLSTAGGFAGCVLGSVFALILARWADWPIDVNLSIMALPLAISLLIGIVFGVGPAMWGARLPPVQTLRAS